MMQRRPLGAAAPTTQSILEEFRDKLMVDKHNLDEELMRNPQLFMDVSEQYALAQSLRDEAKNEIDGAKADEGEQVRQDADAGGYKLSEDRIKVMVAGSEKVKDANTKFNAAYKEAELWRGMQEAFKMRGYMLRELAALFTANYFVRDSVKGGNGAGAAYDAQRARAAEARRARGGSP